MHRFIRATAYATVFLTGAAAPAAALDGSATADNIVSAIINLPGGGTLTYSVPHIEATGTALTSEELKALFSPESSTSIADRLAKMTAATINVPEIDVDETIGRARMRFVYHDVKFVNVSNGTIGAASVASTSFNSNGLDNADVTGTYGAIDARNLNLPLAARLITNARVSDSEKLQPLYDAVTIDSLAVTTSNGANISTGKISAHDIKARELSVSLIDLAKTIGPIQPGTQPSEQQSQAIAHLLSDVFSSFSMGSVEAHDVSIDVPLPKPTKLTLGRIAIDNFADGKIGEISYGGFAMAADDGSFGFDTFALRGLDMRPLLQMVDTALSAGGHGLDGINPRRFLPTLDQVLLANLAFDVPDQKHTGNAVGGARDQMKIGRLEFDAANYLDGIPTAISSALDHLVMQMPANTSDASLKQFLAFGYSGIDLSMRLDLAWNEAAQELSAKEISATLADIGIVRLKATFGNVTKDLFNSDPTTAEAAALGSILKNVDLFVENDGIVEKGVAAEARSENKTPDQIRQELVGGAALGIPVALGNGPAARALGDAAAKFAAQPKTLHLVASSKEGLGAADLALIDKPADLLAKIDLSVTADQ